MLAYCLSILLIGLYMTPHLHAPLESSMDPNLYKDTGTWIIQQTTPIYKLIGTLSQILILMSLNITGL